MQPGTPDPLDDGAAAASRPFWRSRAAVVSAAILVAAAVVVTVMVVVHEKEADTVRTVRAFLTAARDRDPGRALAAAGVTERPTGEEARYLSADAMSDGWEIRNLVEVERFDDSAEVRATIAGPDGRTATATLGLHRGAGGWAIDNPYYRLRIDRGPYWYIEVNGARTPTTATPSDVVYQLLPGLYHLYPTAVAGIDVPYPDLLVLPDDLGHVATSESATVTAAGEAVVQQAVNTYLDACVQRTDAAPRGCPFGTDPVVGPELPEYGFLADPGDVHWRIVQYPTVAAVPTSIGLAITDRSRGVVELRATGEDLDASPVRRVAFTVECESITSRLVAGISADGTVTVMSTYALGGNDAADWRDTCQRPLRVVALG